ncbi:uncharacterized protein ISCGN_003633 [Ixodes scapularis]
MPPRAKKRRNVYMGPDQAYVIPKQTKSNRAARAKRAAELINLSQTSGDGDNSSRCYDLDDSDQSSDSNEDEISNQSSDSNEDEITSGVTSDEQATSDGDNESDDTSEHEELFHDSCTSEDGLASGDTSGSSETGETASSGGGESEQGDPDLTTSGEDESDFKIFEELCSGPPIPGQDSTRGHVLLLILAYVVSAGLSWTQTEGLLRLVNTLFGVFVAPKSKFLFRKVWKQSQQGMVDFHFFCDRCSKPLMVCKTPLQDKKARCSQCKTLYGAEEMVSNGTFFIIFNLRKQCHDLVKNCRKALWDNLEKIAQRSRDIFTDLADGDLVNQARQQFGCAMEDLTASFSTDGSPVFKSSKNSMWPIHVMLNELPPILRWKNLLLGGIWFGKKKPVMSLFLDGFVEQFRRIGAIKWVCHKNGRALESKVYAVCCIADAPARAAVLNRKQFNGYYGCPWCYHKGTLVDGEYNIHSNGSLSFKS